MRNIEGRLHGQVVKFLDWPEAKIWQRTHRGAVLQEVQEQHAAYVAQSNPLRMQVDKRERAGWAKLEDNMGDNTFGMEPEDQLGPHQDQLVATPDGLVIQPIMARRDASGVRGRELAGEGPPTKYRKRNDQRIASCEICGKYVKSQHDAIHEEDIAAETEAWYCLDCAGDELLKRAGIRQAQLYHKPPSAQWGNYFHDRNELAAAMKGFLETALARGIDQTQQLLDFLPILMQSLIADEHAEYRHPKCTPQPDLVEPRYEFTK